MTIAPSSHSISLLFFLLSCLGHCRSLSHAFRVGTFFSTPTQSINKLNRIPCGSLLQRSPPRKKESQRSFHFCNDDNSRHPLEKYRRISTKWALCTSPNGFTDSTSAIRDGESQSTPSSQQTQSSLSSRPSNRRDLHPPTLEAISQALLTRAQNFPNMPLRFVEDGSMEPWEITLSAGKIAQRYVEEWHRKMTLDKIKKMSTEGRKISEEEGDEELQVVGGRIVAVLTRLEELEEELLSRLGNQFNEEGGESGGAHDTKSIETFFNLGVPMEEIKAWQASIGDVSMQARVTATVIDAACLFDEKLRYNRARSLLALFLHEIEGPGLRKNDVVLPCMDVDFLSEEEFELLLRCKDEEDVEGFTSESDVQSSSSFDGKTAKEFDMEEVKDTGVDEEKEVRPSLHPIAIDAIEEALRLRAQNLTTSPLRLIDDKTEWFEVQYSCVKFADRFLEKYKKAASSRFSQNSRDGEDGGFTWTEEEIQTIGGRIVGVLMRLDDLEWEWNHRIVTSPLGNPESSTMIPLNQWKTSLGLHPHDMEQVCFRTVDLALLEDKEFARARAARMMALFLLNIEGPSLEASGNEVPGGSEVNFIEDVVQLELMMPRLKR